MGKKKNVLLLILLFFLCDPIFSVKSSIACNTMKYTFPESHNNFISKIDPYLTYDGIADQFSSAKDSRAEAEKNKKCRLELLSLLEKTSRDKSTLLTRFRRSPLEALVFTVMKLQETPGWLVYKLMQKNKQEGEGAATFEKTSTDPMSLPISNEHKKRISHIKNALQTLSNFKNALREKEVLLDFIARKLSIKSIAFLADIKPETAKKVLDGENRVSIADLMKMLKSEKATSLLGPMEEQDLESIVNAISGLHLEKYAQDLRKEYEKLKLYNKDHISEDEVDTLIKIGLKETISIDQASVLTHLPKSVIIENVDKNKNGKIEFEELKNWLDVTDLCFVALSESEKKNCGEITIKLRENLNKISTIINEAIHILKSDILEKLSLQSEGLASEMTSLLPNEIQGHANKILNRIDKETGGYGTLLSRITSQLIGNESDTVVKWTKIIVWGAIYIFCTIVFVITHADFVKTKYFKIFENTDTKQTNLQISVNENNNKNENNNNENNNLNIEKVKSIIPNLINNLISTKVLSDELIGIEDRWSYVIWAVSIFFMLAGVITYVSWRWFGNRLSFYKMHTTPKWFAREDLWGLFPVIVMGIPLVYYTIHYMKLNDWKNLNVVYLEIMAVVSVYQLGLDWMQREGLGVVDKNLVHDYIAVHESNPLESECDGKSLSDVMNIIFKTYLKKFEHLDCDFSRLFAEFIADEENRIATQNFVEHLTLSHLCLSAWNWNVRETLTSELSFFESILLKLTVGVQEQHLREEQK